MRPLRSRFAKALIVAIVITLLAPFSAPPMGTQTARAFQAPSRSFFGMNLYVTGQERPKEQKYDMLNTAADLGVKWSREEVSWANLEPDKKGIYNWTSFDYWVDQLVQRGVGVVGTIQTTPYWASGVKTTQAGWYWNAPRNPQDFVDFAYTAALHYAGKINVWEIWNEPDVEGTFMCGCDRAARYAQMLAGSYAAIKKANPQATVLIGGLSIHDYNDAGMAFLNTVVTDSGGKLNFDVLSIHPYMPDRMPESTDPNTVVQNFPYRLDMSYKWLQAHGASDKEIWITEDGYSTCTGCGTLGVSEVEQARRLIRLYVIAMGSPGVTHFDYFQAKDKFNSGPGDLWGNMSIMRNDLSQKPSYTAYKVLTQQLTGATFTGLGPITRGVNNRWQAQFDRYQYKFSTPNGPVQVLWKIGEPESVDVPVSQSNVVLMKSDGTSTPLTVNNGTVNVTISEDPIFVDEIAPKTDSNLDAALDPTSPTGFRPSTRFAQYWQQNGGLPLFGYAISGERIERSQTDGKDYIVQWFERARFEYHPEFAGTEAEILLGLLGSQSAGGQSFPLIPPPAGVESVCLQQTGHCVWGRFLERWRELGVPIVGLPISDQHQEKGSDGKTYVVQWFERARFEYHPENQAPYDVLLSLLGKQLFKP
jgi:hypothetical protein